MATHLSKHFTLEELIASSTAKENNIDNSPTSNDMIHLQELVDCILEPLREAWGSGIIVTSGYRGFRLNKAVKGSYISAHLHGYAADIIPCNGNITELKQFVRRWLHQNNIPYDQFIDEKNKNGSEWVHIGIRNHVGEQRKQDLITTDGSHYEYMEPYNFLL